MTPGDAVLCPRCGTRHWSGSMGGLCPRCLGRTLLAVEEVSGTAGALRMTLGGYQLGEEIGRGAMGVVYRARQTALDRPVAVKVLVAAQFLGDSARQRFRAEAEFAARLDHPHIVPILEVGEEDGLPFFAMKLIEGEGLDSWVQRQPACVPPVVAVRLMQQIAGAVHHAHQRGVLHRDLKPSNILMDAEGRPHVTDFGLARRVESDSNLTLSGTPVGTPAYMSPEQAAGSRDISVATDLWSLGVILYELLTGQPPFGGSSVPDVLRAIAEVEPPPPVRSGAGLSASAARDLSTLCLTCLRKEPAQRYPSAQALAADLGRWLRGEPIQARPVSIAERLGKWVRRRPALAGLSGLVVLLFVLGTSGIVWQWHRAERNAAELGHALTQTRDALWQANYDRAHALRTSRRMGQRVGALAAIRDAAALRPDVRLREELAGALALADLEPEGAWRALPSDAAHVVVEPGAAWYVCSTTGGEVRIHQFDDGALVHALPGIGPGAQLELQGSLLVTRSSSGETLWDLRTTKALVRRPWGSLLTPSPDGARYVYRPEGSGLAMVETRTGHEQVRFGDGPPGLVRFSPDSRHVAIEVLQSMEIWALDPPRREARVPLPITTIGCCWHPSERRLAIGGEDGRIYLWQPRLGGAGTAGGDSPSGDSLRPLAGHSREGVVPWFHPSGELLVSTAWDGVLRVWDPRSEQQLLETSSGRPLGFSADGRWLVVRDATRIARWTVHRPEQTRLLPPNPDPGPAFADLRFNPESDLLAAYGASQEVWVWTVASGTAAMRRAHAPVRALGFLGPGQLKVASLGQLETWDFSAPDGPGLHRAPVHTEPIPPHLEQAVFGEASRVVLRYRDAFVVRDAAGREVTIPCAAQPYRAAVSASPDGRWIAAGAWNNEGNFGGELWIWSVATGQPVRRIPLGNCRAFFSPDGRWFVAAGVQQYLQFEVRGTPDQWPEVRRHDRHVSTFVPGTMAFTADGRWLAVQADEQTVRLVRSDTGDELLRLMPWGHDMRELAFSPDGRWLAASTQRGVQVWDLPALRAQLRTRGLDWED